LEYVFDIKGGGEEMEKRWRRSKAISTYQLAYKPAKSAAFQVARQEMKAHTWRSDIDQKARAASYSFEEYASVPPP
jgi:hypothetical protein